MCENTHFFYQIGSIFTNICQCKVKFHEMLLYFYENYSHLRSKCVKIHTFFIKLGQFLLIFVKFHEILLQFQENYSNLGQCKVKFHEILLYFYENYSHLRSKCVKIHTFFIKLGQFLLIFVNLE